MFQISTFSKVSFLKIVESYTVRTNYLNNKSLPLYIQSDTPMIKLTTCIYNNNTFKCIEKKQTNLGVSNLVKYVEYLLQADK